MPSGCNVCNSRIHKLSLFCLWFSFQLRLWSMILILICQSYPSCAPATQGVDPRQERLFRKVTVVSIHSFVEWLDTFSYVLWSADVTVREVNHIMSFTIDIAKDLILLSCRLAMEHLCVSIIPFNMVIFVDWLHFLVYIYIQNVYLLPMNIRYFCVLKQKCRYDASWLFAIK